MYAHGELGYLEREGKRGGASRKKWSPFRVKQAETRSLVRSLFNEVPAKRMRDEI